ncbi:hypothetical protein ABVK25_012031 [Lepraria finkii]|uniref:Carrier domain-containing protein n=1 Tax=Lepraria finkii TaxID=1340010 RepID=A0ABR4ALY7_9LECA
MGSLSLPSIADRASLIDVLRNAAYSPFGLTIYDEHEETSAHISYYELFNTAQTKAKLLMDLPKARPGTVILLHFSTFIENVVWFWAVVSAGILPAVSTPLPANINRRRNHLIHLREILQQPIVLTSRDLVGDFEGVEGINLTIADDISTVCAAKNFELFDHGQSPTEPAAFMLTSGSSGNAKAVALRHEQIIASVRGKSKYFNTVDTDVFLNWIGFDHVASLIETHIHAMYLGADFVHVPAPTLLVDPIKFLTLIDRHRVTYTFAPHFFLARLSEALENPKTPQTALNLSCLRHLISGGESNVVSTGITLGKALRGHDLQCDVIRPGFGMTETCAGAIYSKTFPSYDREQENAFASLGRPIPGIQVRIMGAHGHEASPSEVGNLHVTGEQVFREYFNNSKATMSSFTEDGWFITGDRAFLDANGFLNIAGREQEMINLNGVKYFPDEIESALDDAGISGLIPSWTVVFPSLSQDTLVEEICVAYHPTFSAEQTSERVKAAKEITALVGSITNSRPKHVIPLPKTYLHKSALGKLSRPKIRAAFEKGEYEQYEDSKDPEVRNFKAKQRSIPASATEQSLMAALQDLVGISEEDLGVNNSIFDFGVTSTALFAMKKRIEKDLAFTTRLPIGLLLTIPTIRGIATELDRLRHGSDNKYEPVVPLQSNPNSAKAPLWLIHPGSGDVLVFVKLAMYFSDRTVYGLRTKGLNTGLEDTNYFCSIGEIADTYVESIRKYQPKGPYAITGYSLGSTVAFEVAKRFEAVNDEVVFLGLFDSPPHMRELIENLEWVDVLLNVAYFLELISEQCSVNIATELRQRSVNEALDIIMERAPRDRLEALAIDKTRLHKITEVTNAFRLAGKSMIPQDR